jgi:hypothetical protein
MKALFIALIFASPVLNAQLIKIEDPHAFEFIHCVTAGQNDDDTIIHYVLDVRSADKAVLYWDSAPKKSKASDLSGLKLLDDQVVTNALSDVDLSYISIKNKLVFALNFSNSSDSVLDGELRVGTDTYSVHCVDTSVEK